MKKIILLATAVLFLFATTAMADSIKGKVGITARGGASYIFNSEFKNEALEAMNKDIPPEIGWAAGGGIMYGITDNLAVTFDVIYSEADLKVSTPFMSNVDIIMGKGETIDFSLGAQWRFMTKNAFVPYVGAGFDVLLNKITMSDKFAAVSDNADASFDVGTTYGGHLSVGADCFITPNIALNAEIRGLYSTKGDGTRKKPGLPDTVTMEYNPTNISAFIGLRFFFP